MFYSLENKALIDNRNGQTVTKYKESSGPCLTVPCTKLFSLISSSQTYNLVTCENATKIQRDTRTRGPQKRSAQQHNKKLKHSL